MADGRGFALCGLSQGGGPGPVGSPALPSAGALVKVSRDGSFTVVTGGLNQPTSLEFVGNTAYVVTLGGEIWKIEGVSSLPYGGTLSSPVRTIDHFAGDERRHHDRLRLLGHRLISDGLSRLRASPLQAQQHECSWWGVKCGGLPPSRSDAVGAVTPVGCPPR